MNKPYPDIKLSSTTVIIVLGCLNGLMPFSTDLYLPAFTSMAEGLNTSIASITLTMSTFFAGSCVGQLINGPVLDKYGRKKPMLLGLSIFFITSVWCMLAQNVSILISLRFFQAVGISLCTVGSKAVVRDIFPASETARVFSILALIMGIAPIISPTVGSWLLLSFGWRSIFTFMAVFALLLIGALWWFLPDTLSKDEHYSLRLSNIIRKYKEVLAQKGYFEYTIITSLASAVLFAWISSSSFIFIELLGLSEWQFGMVFAGTASCLVISNQLNILLLKSFQSSDIAIGAVLMELVSCAFLFYTVFYAFNVTNMIIGMCMLNLFLHLITTNAMAMALNRIERNLGIASAFMGSLRMAFSALTTVLISYFLIDSALPMVVIIAVISLLSFVLQFYLKRAVA